MRSEILRRVSFVKRISFFFLLWPAGSGAAEEPGLFLLRVADLHSSKYECTVLTQDGRLRREVTSFNRGYAGRPDVFEGAASEDEVKQVKVLLSEPDFQAAPGNVPAGSTIASSTGRLLSVETSLDGRPHNVTFADRTGTTPIPPYLRGVASFVEEVKKRKLPRLKGKVDTMCRPMSQHSWFP